MINHVLQDYTTRLKAKEKKEKARKTMSSGNVSERADTTVNAASVAMITQLLKQHSIPFRSSKKDDLVKLTLDKLLPEVQFA